MRKKKYSINYDVTKRQKNEKITGMTKLQARGNGNKEYISRLLNRKECSTYMWSKRYTNINIMHHSLTSVQANCNMTKVLKLRTLLGYMVSSSTQSDADIL